MFKYLPLILLFGLVSCGSGSGDDTTSGGTPNASDDPSNFEGTYTYKDDNCEITNPIEKFSLSQTGDLVTLTVITPGNADVEIGDELTGEITSTTSEEGLEVPLVDFRPDLSCIAFLLTEELNDEIHADEGTEVTIDVNDLGLSCDFANDDCSFSYSRR